MVQAIMTHKRVVAGRPDRGYRHCPPWIPGDEDLIIAS
jgi:hypothetical protein